MGPRGGFRRLVEIEEERAADQRAVALRLMRFLTPYWPQLVLACVLVITNAVTFSLAPYLIGRAIDEFIAAGDRAGLVRIVLLLLVTYLVGMGSMSGQMYVMGWTGQHVLAHMREQICAKIQTLGLRYFDRHDAGDLMSRLTNDVDVLNQLLTNGLAQMVGGLLQMLAIVIAMLMLNWQLALASFTVIPAMLLIINGLARRARSAFRKARTTIGDVSAELEENIAAVRVAQAYGREEINRQRFAEINAANRDANVSAVGITAAFAPAMDVLSSIAVAIVTGMGGTLVISGATSVGIVISFLRYVQLFFHPVQQISTVYALLQAALAASERVFDLLDEPPELVDAPDAVPMPPIRGEVVFEHVDFAYDTAPQDGREREPVLRDINLIARPGETVAIVGATGAGKTTLVNLVARFYDVTAGRILIDGLDIRKVTVASLRRQLGIVPQDSFLFSGTVADNIRYGRLDASDEEVIAAAQLIGAHEFIMRLPAGYQTEIGERGGTLSQGQRQLIALTRAVLADPRILILDEATASIDTRTERAIQQALEILFRGRTSFVVAHRLSTVRNADRIYVLDAGRIVEHGRHDELLARGGLYAQLYARQFRDLAPVKVHASATSI
ncbi:MAG: ABC transporter ATP-binding protein [Ardenticatenia bacterium]|nr:MAG: ABC transporter ATP-binding protein [Ardenticatenia bacterium]